MRQHDDGLSELAEALDDYMRAERERREFLASRGVMNLCTDDFLTAGRLNEVRDNTHRALMGAYGKLPAQPRRGGDDQRAYFALRERDLKRTRVEARMRHVVNLANRLRTIRATTPEGEGILHDLAAALLSLELTQREQP